MRRIALRMQTDNINSQLYHTAFRSRRSTLAYYYVCVRTRTNIRTHAWSDIMRVHAPALGPQCTQLAYTTHTHIYTHTYTDTYTVQAWHIMHIHTSSASVNIGADPCRPTIFYVRSACTYCTFLGSIANVRTCACICYLS